ncbi:MAG: peptide deformylase [Hyphomicrobiales bacterium]|nr:peptide deformylase [Hyphomicrobiales bacterium]
MSLQPILLLPDNRLRLISDPVRAVDDGVRTLMDDMLETMYDAPGIGLAAIQIAVSKRVVVIDVAKREGEEQEEVKNPIYLVNPEIVRVSDEISTYEEGCLSIPDYYAEVARPAKVRVRYLDRAGTMQEMDADGVLATCIQHELDHLDGVLFIDHLSRLKRDRVLKRFNKDAKRRLD